VTWSSVIWI